MGSGETSLPGTNHHDISNAHHRNVSSDREKTKCCRGADWNPMSTPTIHGPTQDFLKALASETRQQIMMLFSGGTQLTVGEVADACGLGQSTTSEQLTILKRGGLLPSTRDGKLVRYRADPTTIAARLTDLQNYLACCCPPAVDTEPES